MNNAKLIKIGNSVGVRIPKEALEKLNLSEGDELTLTVDNEGINLTPYDPDFHTAMAIYKKNASRFRNAMRALADG